MMNGQANLTRKRRLGLVLMVAMLGAAIAMAVSLLPASGSSLPKPSGVEVSVVSTGLKITWDAPDTSGATLPGQLLSYKVERRPGTANDWAVLEEDTESTVTSYTDTGGDINGRFITGRLYFYRVSAIYDDGNDGTVTSEASDHDSEHGPEYPEPLDLAREATDDGVKLTWTAPDLSEHGSSLASHSGYVLWTSTRDGNTVVSLDDDDTSYTHTDGDWKATYHMIAVYGVFESWKQYFPRGEQPDVPAPSGLDGEATTLGLKITWDAPDTSDMSVDATLSGYEIQRRRSSPNFTVIVEDSGRTDTEHVDTDPGSNEFFISGEEWKYRVRAIYEDSDGIEYRSDPTDAHTVTVPSYLAPRNLSSDLSSDGDDIELDWDAPTISWSADRAALTGYRLEITTPSARHSTHDLGTGTTSYSLEHNELGFYDFYLRAVYGVFASIFVDTRITIDWVPD